MQNDRLHERSVYQEQVLDYNNVGSGPLLGPDKKDREARVMMLSDSYLLCLHSDLKGSRLFEDDLWLPFLENEIAGRNIARSA